MAISGAASKVAKKFQNSKINQKLTKKLDDVTSSLKSKTKNITANIAKKTKEATQKAVNTVSDKAKTIANKTLSGTNIVKNAISNGIKNAPKGEKNKVASVIDSLGEGILSVRNVFAPQKVINAGPINIVVKDIKTGFGQSGEETLSQFLSKDVKKLKTMFFSQGSESGSKTFYTVQNSADAKRLLSDGLPWPTDPHRANLGDGVYAWSSKEDAINYFNIKSKRTDDLQILEFEVLQTDLNKMKQLDLTKMSDDEVNTFLDNYARLNGGTPNHGYDYIQRMTGLGVENYFNKSVYGKLKFKH